MKHILAISSVGFIMILSLSSIEGRMEETKRAVSFSQDVLPIVLRSCSTIDCHGNERVPILLTYKKISKYSTRIKNRLVDPKEPMPPKYSDKQLTSHEVEIILRWIRQGSPNN